MFQIFNTLLLVCVANQQVTVNDGIVEAALRQALSRRVVTLAKIGSGSDIVKWETRIRAIAARHGARVVIVPAANKRVDVRLDATCMLKGSD